MIRVVDEARLKGDLERLVGFDTQNPPGREAECAGFLRDLMNGMRCRTDVVRVDEHRSNVVGIFENGAGPVFAFNTHIDVVPAGDGWTSAPFSLREAGGRLYGRGACDAKGPLAAMIEAMRLLIAASKDWSGTLVGVFVCDEEVGSLGARSFSQTAAPIDYCVIGEPTSVTTVIAHKGSLRPIVRIHGKSAHSGMPDLGVNAIQKSVPLLNMVLSEHERTKLKSHPLVGAASLTIVRVNGGTANNVVPESCDFVLDRRMVPGEDETQVLNDLERMVSLASAEAGVPAEIIGFAPTTGPSSQTASDHPIVVAAQKVCHLHNHAETPVGGFQGGCDLVHFRKLGAAGVVIGPGSLQVAHQPDEYVPVDELVRSVSVYRDLAMEMLAHKRTPQPPKRQHE